jgi:hypothetical protein
MILHTSHCPRQCCAFRQRRNVRLASHVLITVVTATGVAGAQPGATPPHEAPQGDPPPQDAPPERYPPPEGSPPPEDPRPWILRRLAQSSHVDDLFARIEAQSPTIQTVALGALRRARRSVSIGPTIGAWIAAVPSPGEYEHAITFGIGLEMFKIPVMPGPETLKALVVERAKAKLKQQLLARFRGDPADPIALEQLAREIWQEAIDEVLGLENIRPKTMERPKLTLALEVNRLVRAEAWMPRLRVGVGVWKLTVGASFGPAFGDSTGIFVGPEVVAHFLTSKKPRASVVDVFLRADFEVRNRDTNTDHLVLGARFLLDVI